MSHTAEEGAQVTLAEIAAELRDAPKVLVATHENPDGDAIGSARAAELVLQHLGVDVAVYVPRGDVPDGYDFVQPDRLLSSAPDDIDERLLLAVDCGNASRLADDTLVERARRVINVDHHGDNTRFGHLNHVRADAACAAELVRELAGELGVPLTRDIATAIYVGLVTDTGRFQYSNTSPDSFRLAAELVEAGVVTYGVYRTIYERTDFSRLKLLGRGLEKAQTHAGGGLVATSLTLDDYRYAGGLDVDGDGIVDALRGAKGAKVALFVRELGDESPFARKGSLRTTRDDIDVSAIARNWSGGGHRQAAGFSTDDDFDSIVAYVVAMLEGRD
jgi:phosphoesterase RecJ-like protein